MRKVIERKILFLRPEKILCHDCHSRSDPNDPCLSLLADNISANGIIEPLIVRQNNSGNYELIAGRRRLEAAKLLGLRRVPCIRFYADSETAVILSLSENTNRTRLNCFDEALSIQKIVNRFGIDYKNVALRLGLAESSLLNKIKLLKLSQDIREKIISAALPEKIALITLMISEEKQNAFIDEVIKNSLDVKEAKQLMQKYIFSDFAIRESKPRDISPQGLTKVAIGDIRIFDNSLSKLVATMQSSGIDAYSERNEGDSFLEYKIVIPKGQAESKGQFRIVN